MERTFEPTRDTRIPRMQVARIPLEIMDPQEVNTGVIVCKFNPFLGDQTMKIYEQLHLFTLMKRRCGVKQGSV